MTIATACLGITPSDTANLPGATTGGIWVGAAGTVTVTLLGGNLGVFVATGSGVIPVCATKVWQTGTGSGLNLMGLK